MATNTCPKCDTSNRSSARFCANCGAPLLRGVEQASESGALSRPQLDRAPLESSAILQGRYRIERELGRGGFGAVYRAWDVNLKRSCAVKENLDTSPEAQRQFAREASVLANLSHPNLPRVTDHFTIEDQGQYLVMDFVEGEDLNSLMESQGKLPLVQSLKWVSQVADALTYLHSRQPPVVHRDIKPANIRITPEGKAMLVDFGLVKMYDPHMKTTLGARAVTPGYAPPEQYGRGSTDPRTDVYALGATLYKLITDKEPLESVQRMIGRQMTPANQITPGIPVHVSRAIERAMDLEPDQRYQSAAEFKQALSEPAPAWDATMLVKPVAETQVRPSVTPSSVASPSVVPVAPPPAVSVSPPVERKGGSKMALWLGIGVIVVLFLGIVLTLGVWGLSANKASVSKTADAEYRATLAERVRTTSTALAQPTATAKSPATTATQAAPAAQTSVTAAPRGAVADSQRVLFSSIGSDDTIVQLTGGKSFDFGRRDSPDVAWSPDGQWIVFASAQADSNGDGQVNGKDHADLYLIRPDGSGLIRLTDTPDISESEPSWTLDGRQILFSTSGEDDSALWIVNVDGSGLRPLMDGYGYVHDSVQIP